MKQITHVTVSIPAHNEARNIQQILKDVLHQTQDSWHLDRVLVICDGCTDRTAAKAKALKHAKIKVIDDGRQVGQLQRMKTARDATKSPVIVFFDADIKLKDTSVITQLVKSLKEDKQVMLVGGNSRPFPPQTFFQRAVYATFEVFDQTRQLHHGQTIYSCTGSCLAVKTSFLQQLKFPALINNDDYLYFSCLKLGYQFRYSPKAIIYYKLPLSVSEHIHQTLRSSPDSVVQNFTHEFGPIVAQEYHRPRTWLIGVIFDSFLQHPLEVTFMTGLTLLLKPFVRWQARSMKPVWQSPVSTK